MDLLSVLLEGALHVCEQPKAKLGGTAASAHTSIWCLATPLLGTSVPPNPNFWAGAAWQVQLVGLCFTGGQSEWQESLFWP